MSIISNKEGRFGKKVILKAPKNDMEKQFEIQM